MKDPFPWKMIGRYEDGEEIIVVGSNAKDCKMKLIELEKLHGELTDLSDVSDDRYERGQYIGKENVEKLRGIRKLLDKHMFIVSLKERMEAVIFDAVRDFGGYDDPQKMEMVIPYVQQSYVRLKLLDTYWSMTSPPQESANEDSE